MTSSNVSPSDHPLLGTELEGTGSAAHSPLHAAKSAIKRSDLIVEDPCRTTQGTLALNLLGLGARCLIHGSLSGG